MAFTRQSQIQATNFIADSQYQIESILGEYIGNETWGQRMGVRTNGSTVCVHLWLFMQKMHETIGLPKIANQMFH